jgi:hypothetical protein
MWLIDETIWLSQKQICDLFQKDVRMVSEYVREVFEKRELASSSTVRNFRLVRSEGSRQIKRDVARCNLDAKCACDSVPTLLHIISSVPTFSRETVVG